MRLVIDSNRFMAGVLRDSCSRELILSGRFEFYSPDRLTVEVEKHEDYLAQKSGLTERQLDVVLSTLLDNVTLVPYEEFKDWFGVAVDIMKDIDVRDAPFLAVGLALDLDGIWTEDRHFYEQDRLKVYGTGDLMKALKRLGRGYR